ncbi:MULTISPECIES: FAD-dependent monooxygenase [unclassified Paenibacillus]|uniref:FAD-dependent monooxygenase n=1 Tax=unclassified Paenibacillus TaxID=185978 RepID=UPI0006CF7C87|nr:MULTISPECIES: FAD-dependent monooxygenase [unclassified Paenibacillus]
MTKTNNIPFMVIGGGIGGLAAALSIAKTGRPVQVLEQAPEFAEVGAGLQLAPNALAVLDKLGVLGTVMEKAVAPRRLVLMDAITGQEMTALDLGGAFLRRYGYPYIVTHRSDLLDALLAACRSHDLITLLNNKEALSVEDLGDRARVSCRDGSVYTADAVIGADGLWSRTRKLFVEDKAVCSHYVAYRGTIPISEIPEANLDDVVCWIGPNLHLVQYPVRRKELYNQVVVFRSYQYKEDSDDWGTTAELDERFSVCCPSVLNAVSFIHRQRRWPLYDRQPIHTWTEGRIALLGDSGHPMLQYLAQGACQALEDAFVLGEKLEAHGSQIQQAFMAYQQERAPRAAKVQQTARVFGDILHTEDNTAILLRNAILSQRKTDDYSVVDWLYGTFVPMNQER